MSSPRTPDERRTDAALLLTLWASCAQIPREDAGDKLRQMKLAFLAAHRLREDAVQALNLSFYRWTWGPMSNEVYDAWEILERAGLLESEEHFVFTRAGESLARAFYDEVLKDERNAPIRDVIDEIAATWRKKPNTGPLLDFVYAMQVVPVAGLKHQAVEDIAKGADLLEPVASHEARASLFVDRGWLETLALELTPSATAALKSAQADYREGRFQVA